MPNKWKDITKSDFNRRLKKKNNLHINIVIKTIRKINDLITRENNKQKLIKKICNTLIQTDGYLSAWIGLIDRSNNLIATSEAGFGKKFLSVIEKAKESNYLNCFNIALKSPDIFITDKNHAECQKCIFPKYFGKGLGIVIRLEYMGKIYGVLLVSLRKELIHDQEELELFKTIAKDVAIALHNIDLEEKRRLKEKELMSVKKNLEQIFNTALPMFIADKNLKIIQVNDTFCSFIRKRREEIIGKRCFNIWQNESCIKSKKSLKLVLERGESQEFEFEAEFNNGTRIISIVKSVPHRNPAGEIIGLINSFVDITERKITEQKLKESERNYKNIIESTKDGVIIVGFDGKIKFISHQISSLLGKNIVKLQSNFFSYVHPDDRMSITKLFQEALRKKSSLEDNIIEFRALKKKGNYIWLSSSTKNYYDREGSVIGFISVLRDITHRKKIDEVLKESEQKYKDLFDASPHPIVIANMEGEIVDCNSATETMIGYKKKEFLNNDSTHISSFVSKFMHLLNEKKLEKKDKEYEFDPQELKIKKIDDNYLWVKVQPSIIKIGRSKFIYLIFQDITRIKQSEREFFQLEKTLEELDALIENAPLAILLLHQTTKILRGNAEAHSLLEFNEEELLSLEVFQLFERSNLNTAKKYYTNDIFDPTTSNKLETQIITKNGKTIDIEVTSTVLKISDNIIIQSYFSDITERKKHDRIRQQLLDQLVTSLEFKAKFLATMSHELRTPLNSLLGFSQLLLMESYGKINNEQKEFLMDIKSAGEDLLILIDSILDLSKIDAGKFKLNLKKIKLQYLMEQVKTTIRPLYIKKKLGFLVEGIESGDFLIVDPGHFKRILYNLLSNAIKFTEKGIITLRGIERNDHWEFQVNDMGVGIAKQDFDVVFREFGRVENDRIKNIPGTGLGLALTKHLVILHEGDIWFESELEKGTTFFFTIPKREDF